MISALAMVPSSLVQTPRPNKKVNRSFYRASVVVLVYFFHFKTTTQEALQS